MTGSRAGSPNHSPEELELGLAAWIRLGTSEAAARETSVHAGSLRKHKSRHPEKWRELTEAHERAICARRRAIAADVVEGIAEGVLVSRRLLRGDLAGAASAAQAAASVVRALASVDRNLDTYARLDAGSPTAITEAGEVDCRRFLFHF